MTKIAVHMTGGIAVYKAVEVVRGLQKQGHEVRVAMTQNAARFVGPATLAALTKQPVLIDQWAATLNGQVPHIELADWSELALVVPATANLLAKWQQVWLMTLFQPRFWQPARQRSWSQP